MFQQLEKGEENRRDSLGGLCHDYVHLSPQPTPGLQGQESRGLRLSREWVQSMLTGREALNPLPQ